jgi:hypothetical protein
MPVLLLTAAATALTVGASSIVQIAAAGAATAISNDQIQRGFFGQGLTRHVTPLRAWPREGRSRENDAGSLFLERLRGGMKRSSAFAYNLTLCQIAYIARLSPSTYIVSLYAFAYPVQGGAR